MLKQYVADDRMIARYAAASARLCVETNDIRGSGNDPYVAAASARLCVETQIL